MAQTKLTTGICSFNRETCCLRESLRQPPVPNTNKTEFQTIATPTDTYQIMEKMAEKLDLAW